MGAWIETPASRAMPPIRSVAHYVGAWIETKVSADSRLSSTSHPTWVRGLKLVMTVQSGSQASVAPYVGAWIETRGWDAETTIKWVAPYVGAWIETNGGLNNIVSGLCRTLRGCVD